MQLPFSSWLLTLVALLVNTSETTANTPLLSTTIFPSKPSLTDKCLFCWEDPLVEKLTLVMSSISTLVFSREPLKCTRTTEPVPLPPSPSLKPKLVMCPLISPPTLFPLLTDRFSSRQSFSTRVSDLLSTSVFPSPESVQPLRSRPWRDSLVLSRTLSPNTENLLPSLNSGTNNLSHFFVDKIHKSTFPFINIWISFLFSSNLDATTQKFLNTGERLVEMLKQN